MTAKELGAAIAEAMAWLPFHVRERLQDGELVALKEWNDDGQQLLETWQKKMIEATSRATKAEEQLALVKAAAARSERMTRVCAASSIFAGRLSYDWEKGAE